MIKLCDFYRERPVLVAGADGFLGSNCAVSLVTLGARVTVLTRRDQPAVSDGVERVVRGTLNDEGVAAEAVAGQEIIFDFVGNASPVRSNDLSVVRPVDECRPHLNLYFACTRCDPPPLVVLCSSRLVYGKPRYLPVDERHPVQPQCFYAVERLTLEHSLYALSHTTDVGHVVLRLSNPYGLHPSSHPNGHTLLNVFIRKAQQGQTLTLYGDGGQLRDYIYVDDMTDAFLGCAATPACRNRTFNLGGAESISLRRAAELIVGRFGGDIETVPWPADYSLIETGDYKTDLTALHGVVDLAPPRPLAQGLADMAAGQRSPSASKNQNERAGL